MLLKLIGAMALILIVIYGSVWLMKKYSFGKMERGGNLISIVERRHLTPKQVIYLVKVGEKHLLVGSSESGLTKISDVEALALRPPQSQTATSPSSKFNQLLKQAKETLIPFISVKEQELEAKS
jgi:flagellar biosynthetic protein FliO